MQVKGAWAEDQNVHMRNCKHVMLWKAQVLFCSLHCKAKASVLLLSNEMRILALLHFSQLILINLMAKKQAWWRRGERETFLVWDL